jgi:uncharacterized protein (TIGR02145 family)
MKIKLEFLGCLICLYTIFSCTPDGDEPIGESPEASFTASPTSIVEGQNVQFTDLSTHAPTSWSWDFGDGSSSSLQSPSHVYNNQGSYSVSLTVSNSFGSDTKDIANLINVGPSGSAPIADFTVTPSTITAGGSVQFTDLSTNTPASWNWDFGDGNNSTAQSPSHVYNNVGTYNVTLTVTNAFGSDSETKPNLITVNPTGNAPAAAFTVSKTTITAGQFVKFTDQSTNTPTSWSWSFGDGGTSTNQHPEHSYLTAGVFAVTLTASNASGSGVETKSNYITVNAGDGGSFTDSRDARKYNWIEIGGRVWMAENLNLGTRLNANQNQTNNSIYEKYCYDNDESKCTEYGGLYQWNEAMQYSASNNSNPGQVRGVCPTGWHLPTHNEWKELEMDLGMSQTDADMETWRLNSDVGGKLKESGYNHWAFPNAGATNSTGFGALPGGKRSYDLMEFSLITTEAYFWSATEKSTDLGIIRHLVSHEPGIGFESYYKTNGFSVRCIKD